jgi:hypothetical protein
MTNLSDLLPAGAASKQLSFTADGAIASGQTVALQTAGTVKAVGTIAEALGADANFIAGTNPDHVSSCFDSSSGKTIISFVGNSNYGYVVVGTPNASDNTITFGTPVVYNSNTTDVNSITYDVAQNKVLIAYANGGNSYLVWAVVGTVSGTSISLGTASAQSGSASDGQGGIATVYEANAAKHVLAFKNGSSSNRLDAQVMTISGTSVSSGSALTNIAGGQVRWVSTAYDSSAQKVIIAYQDFDSSYHGKAVVATVSGTSISAGSENSFNAASTNYVNAEYDPSANKIIIAYKNSSNPTAVVGTVSGTSISFGSATVASSSSDNDYYGSAFDTTANKFILAFLDNDDNTGKYVVGTVSGTSISFATPVTFNTGAGGGQLLRYISPSYNATADRTVISFQNGASSNGTSVMLRLAGSNSSSFLGIADAAISNAASGKITMKGGVATNSAISPAAVVTAGSQVVFDDGGPTTGISLVYDPDSTKIVTAFCTTTLHGIVGTVSGTGITYGTAVQANSNNSGEAQIVYDTANDKVVVVYTNNNNSYGEAVVGTVSGTSISWGSVVVWNSASTSGLSAAYDTNAGKVLVAWKNSGTASGIVGTVSGTSISFGSSATIFSGGNLQETRMVYDANAQKSVVAIRDYSPQKGYAVVATISGTSVTVGSSVEFLSSEVTSQSIALAYNSTDNNVVIAYSKAGDSNNGFLAIGTISGTSISFAGETKYSSSNQTNYVKLAYKSSGNMLGIIYNIGGSTTVKFNHATISGTTFSFGTEQELTAGATDSTAITLDVASDNFVASYGDGANSNDGTTNVVNLNTSLVPNTTYYVQNDGTLSTTSSTVTAGKAMSTNSINLDYST